MTSRVLLEDESIVLWREYRRTGDLSIRNSLVMRHMGLVYQIANKYAAVARDAHDDLIQEGCLGLIRAIERFLPDYGVQFSTYAYPVISGTIKNYLRDRRRLLGMPRWERNEESEFGTPDTYVAEGEELLAPESLEALADPVGEDFTEQIVDRMLAKNLLGRLPVLEQRIVQHFFYDDLTQREVARIVARSTSRISRILRQALEKIRGLLLDVQKEEDRLISPGALRLIVPGVVDEETGLFGIQHLRRSLTREVARAQVHGAPLTLAIIRPNGSEAPITAATLAAAAKRIYQQVRVLDHVFRAGQSELALIFSLPFKETSLICDRLQRSSPPDEVLHCALASFPSDARTARELLGAARQRFESDPSPPRIIA
ncbi:MAG: sigma-70 family RNA polymerase sigma factor [Armatimonadota bacterium]|jgi:RNA polymerase sigma-B factor